MAEREVAERERLRGEIRRAGLRHAAQVGWLLARAHQRASDRHPDALAWVVRPRLMRAVLLWMVGVLMTLLAETWIAGAPSACLTIQRVGRPWRFAARGLGCVVVGSALAIAVYGALHAALPPLAADLAFEVPLLVVLGFALVFIAVELAGNPLRGARRRVRRALPEPVWHIQALASIEPGAGRSLGQALAAMADAQGATLLADADGRARLRLYRAEGFAEAVSTTRPWGRAAVLVRPPQPTAPTSSR